METIANTTPEHQTAHKVFISYSWDNPEVKAAVEELANRLEQDGVQTVLDKKDLRPGQDMNHFMLLPRNDKTITKVLLICDNTYKMKADARISGVGKEVGIIQGELLDNPMQTRIIPVSWDEDFESSLPNFCKDRYGLLFPRGKDAEPKYQELLATILSGIPSPKNTINVNLISYKSQTSVFRTDREQVVDFFHNRFCRAFPDWDICPMHSEKKDIRTRLRTLFKRPVESDSIWWLSAEGTGEFTFFDFDPFSNKEYFADEGAGWFSCFNLTKVVPICFGTADWTANIYVESAPTVLPSQPFSRTGSDYTIRFFHKSGRELSGSERNCGCFYEDGICHEFSSSDVIEVTTRAQPFNCLICPKFGPVIQGRRDFEIVDILNAILERKQTVDDLRDYLLRIPKPAFKFENIPVVHVSENTHAWAKPDVLSNWLSR